MEQGCFMVDHVSYLARAYNIPPRLVVNSDQTRIHLVPITKECMWKNKDNKHVHVLGVENKKQIIIVISSSTNGIYLHL
jgi:hypothetical protein